MARGNNSSSFCGRRYPARYLRLASLVLPVGMLVVGSSAASTGCSSTCTTASSPEETIPFQDGLVSSDGRAYMTAGFEGPYLNFPPGRTFQFMHGLGVTPFTVNTYLSFSPEGLPESNISESAGNQAVIEVIDSEMIQIRNDTCSEFYIRVSASAADFGELSPVGAGGQAGSAAGAAGSAGAGGVGGTGGSGS